MTKLLVLPLFLFASLCVAQINNPTSSAPTGAAGGDLSGTYPNPGVATLANATGLPLNGVASPTSAPAAYVMGVNTLDFTYALTSDSIEGITFEEATAATNGTAGNQFIMEVTTLAGSTATPMNVSNSLTGSQVLPVATFTPTWNTSGTAIGLQETITNTAAANVSRAFDIKLGATNFFYLALQSGTPATAASTGVSMVLGGSKPQISAAGTTPYLNLNLLTKGTLNTCTFALTTSTFTLALSPVSLCTYTLPNTALTWYWSCTVGWSNPAGTTPTFAIGVTWAQAPSVAFNMADIYTTNAGVGVEGATSTTTNANILTSGTLTTSATIFQAQASGTFTGSATSGTFSPTVSLTGTGATGTAVGGCTIQ